MSEGRNLTADDNGKTIQVKRGTMLYYEATFGTSAYQWRDPLVTGTSIKYAGVAFQPRADPTPIPGATQQGSFSFRAESKGTSTLELRQGYVSDDQTDLTFGITVVVK